MQASPPFSAEMFPLSSLLPVRALTHPNALCIRGRLGQRRYGVQQLGARFSRGIPPAVACVRKACPPALPLGVNCPWGLAPSPPPCCVVRELAWGRSFKVTESCIISVAVISVACGVLEHTVFKQFGEPHPPALDTALHSPRLSLSPLPPPPPPPPPPASPAPCTSRRRRKHAQSFRRSSRRGATTPCLQ